ncbi:MAG: hypothetical protein H6822_19195 [Planctomycetaceae bacterium]|nr:hypothetical protein [Planctomycetaceae bacterium]
MDFFQASTILNGWVFCGNGCGEHPHLSVYRVRREYFLGVIPWGYKVTIIDQHNDGDFATVSPSIPNLNIEGASEIQRLYKEARETIIGLAGKHPQVVKA